MFSVLVSGFPTKEAAEAWAEWYSGQGEQDAPIWLEEALDSPGCSAYTDGRATFPLKWNANTVSLVVKFEKR